MKDILIKIIPVGMLETNCYIVGDPASGEGIIIDPGDEFSKIAAAIDSTKLKIKYLINTHGHHDHIGADWQVKEKYGCRILIHEEDAGMLGNPLLNLSFKKDRSEVKDLQADQLLQEGDVVSAGAIKLEVIHTPGHTPGCICLLGNGYLFTGDTLFAGAVGRTDLPGGSFEKLNNSIQTKLKPLPDTLKIYPGHGASSTIGREKRENPFM